MCIGREVFVVELEQRFRHRGELWMVKFLGLATIYVDSLASSVMCSVAFLRIYSLLLLKCKICEPRC